MFRFFHSVDVTMYVGLEFQICAPNSKNSSSHARRRTRVVCVFRRRPEEEESRQTRRRKNDGTFACCVQDLLDFCPDSPNRRLFDGHLRFSHFSRPSKIRKKAFVKSFSARSNLLVIHHLQAIDVITRSRDG